MERKQFEGIVDELVQKELDLLGWKRTEYTSSKDVLQNFKQNAQFLGMEPEEIALVYLTKHYQSIVIAVQTHRYNWVWETANGSEGLKQRFADMVNYAHLLAAIIDEHESEEAINAEPKIELPMPYTEFYKKKEEPQCE